MRDEFKMKRMKTMVKTCMISMMLTVIVKKMMEYESETDM